MKKTEEIKKLVFCYMDALTSQRHSDLKDIYTKFIDLSETKNYKDIVRNAVSEYEDTHLDKSIAWWGASILLTPDLEKLNEFLTLSVIVNKKKKS